MNKLRKLKEKGNDIPVFLDLIDSYMDLWIVKELLNNDISERGVYVTTLNAKNQEIQKKNDSVGELSKITAQMLKVLSHLKLEINDNKAPINDDDEL